MIKIDILILDLNYLTTMNNNIICETDSITFRRFTRAIEVNNEYQYIGGDNYEHRNRTQIIDELPEWYNNGLIGGFANGADEQDGSTMIRTRFIQEPHENIDVGFIEYYDNNENNWVIPDGSLHGHFTVITVGLDEQTINTHINMIRDNYNYENIEEIANIARINLEEYMNIP